MSQAPGFNTSNRVLQVFKVIIVSPEIYKAFMNPNMK